jgi:hypothetical protein
MHTFLVKFFNFSQLPVIAVDRGRLVCELGVGCVGGVRTPSPMIRRSAVRPRLFVRAANDHVHNVRARA